MLREPVETKKDIVEHLLWDSRIEGADIDVEVDDEHGVTLSGTAPSTLVKQAAAEDAFAIPGIRRVANKITVQEGTSGLPHKGRALQSALQTVFSLYRGMDNVEVQVADGHVRLSGSVDTVWKKMRAVEIACETAGTEQVQNALAVVPSHSPQDKAVAESILSAIRRTGKADPEKVTVEVRGGEVTLTGTLDNWEELSSVYSAAKYTHGVISIDNRLRISLMPT
jgi:osmotically-inducible protein OsmY